MTDQDNIDVVPDAPVSTIADIVEDVIKDTVEIEATEPAAANNDVAGSVGSVAKLNFPPQEVSDITPEKAAAETKKASVNKEDGKGNAIRYTSDGIGYKLHPVAANVMREASARIPDPRMRTFNNPTTGKEEENPAHPEYTKELNEVRDQRIKASMNALVLFGLELVSPVPTDNIWLKKLIYINLITQAEFDEATGAEGEFLRELFYKQYVISDVKILSELSTLSGVTKEDIAIARESFRSPA